MIQTYQNLSDQASLVNNNFNGQVFIQKIYSSARYICLNLRGPGQTFQLYFGRGHGHEGIWLDQYPLKSFLRKKDVFLEYLRKHLAGTTFLELELDEFDRIFTIHYQKWGHKNSLSIFYNGRELVFAHFFFDKEKNNYYLLRSWDHKSKVASEFNFDIFDEMGRRKMERFKIKEIISIRKLLDDEEKDAISKGINANKKESFLDRKLLNIQKDLNRVKIIPRLIELTESEELDKLPPKNKFESIRINFKEKTHFKRRDEVFKKIKSLKNATNILTERLEQTKKQKDEKINLRHENGLNVIKINWKQSHPKKNLEKSDEITKTNEFTIFEKIKIAIGKSAKENDYLRSKWANKDDYWFHIYGDKSAHLFVKGDFKPLGEEFYNVIGSVLLEFSQLDYSEVDLIYTQVKNLKGVKNSPGKVLYKKEKHVRAKKISDWRNPF